MPGFGAALMKASDGLMGWQSQEVFVYQGSVEGLAEWPKGTAAKGYLAARFGKVIVLAEPGVVYDYKRFLTPLVVSLGKQFAQVLNSGGYKELATDGPFVDVAPMAPRDDEEYGPGFRPPLVSH